MTGCGFLYHFQHTSIVSGQKLYPDYKRGTKFYDNRSSRVEKYNPRQNVWDTLYFRWGKCMQFKLTPTRTVLGEKVKHLLRFLHTIRTSTLFRKGRGDKNRVKAVFIRVSYKFHTCEKDLEEVSQNLLARRIAFPKSLPNVIIWYFLILVTTNRTKVLDF